MQVDHADSTDEDPDVPFDYEDEDEIMGELRQIRRKIMAEFNNDLGAYFRYIRAQEEEERKRGRIIVDFSLRDRPRTDAA
jgi:hypothetical protein